MCTHASLLSKSESKLNLNQNGTVSLLWGVFSPWVRGVLPNYKNKPRKPKPEVKSLHVEKFSDIVAKGYVRGPREAEHGFVKSLFDITNTVLARHRDTLSHCASISAVGDGKCILVF